MTDYVVQIVNEAPTVTVSGDTITVSSFQYPPDASATVKGLATFDAGNFSVVDGNVTLTLADGGTF